MAPVDAAPRAFLRSVPDAEGQPPRRRLDDRDPHRHARAVGLFRTRHHAHELKDLEAGQASLRPCDLALAKKRARLERQFPSHDLLLDVLQAVHGHFAERHLGTGIGAKGHDDVSRRLARALTGV